MVFEILFLGEERDRKICNREASRQTVRATFRFFFLCCVTVAADSLFAAARAVFEVTAGMVRVSWHDPTVAATARAFVRNRSESPTVRKDDRVFAATPRSAHVLTTVIAGVGVGVGRLGMVLVS